MRKMAVVKRIDRLSPIAGADRIELAHIGGWQVVVKKGEFQEKDLAVYLEIDSWVPHTLAPFLTKDGHYPKVYNEIEGQRLKTVRLKGEISQGLLLSMDVLIGSGAWASGENLEEADVSEILGIQKWEKPLAACLAGTAKGNFPSEVPKTDQERVQNISRQLEKYVENDVMFEVTEKLHGSSCTFYLDIDGVFHVCSRNIDLKETETNSFWRIARLQDVENKMRAMDMFGVAIQGELVGQGINGNQYEIADIDFYVFDIYDTVTKTLLGSDERISKVKVMNLKHVPVIHEQCALPLNETVKTLLLAAEGKSVLNGSKREGLVFKSLDNPNESFKVVSNAWLMAGGEDQ